MIEWLGVVGAAIGSFILALNIPFSKYSYALMAISSACLIYDAMNKSNKPYVFLNSWFLIINMMGIARWILDK